jgi:Tfp pilus assembly protein PilO
MFRYAVPIILIGVAVAGFFIVVNPLYQDISNMQAQAVSYNQALDNSKALEAQRDALTQKYNSIDPDNLAKLQKLLPDNVDNIRLILEIEGVASPYGMVLKDVKYDTTSQTNATTQNNNPAQTAVAANSNYGTWNLQFSTQGSYSNFLNFITDLEKNLRIVDISSIDFSSNTGDTSGTTGASLGSSSANYTYTFNIKTYWLKG